MGPSGTKRLIAVGISGVVALSLLFVAAWLIFSGGSDDAEPDGVQIIAPSEDVGSGPEISLSTAVSSPAPTVTASPRQIAVYITGAVVNPGVYSVADGERLETVLQLAGGPTGDADLSRVNLAGYVADAAHYKIPAASEHGTAHGPGSGGSSESVSQVTVSQRCQTPVNINTASAQCLETLPGIGAVRANSIVAHREAAGTFTSPDTITDVPGIGDGIYRRIAEMITIAAP